MADNPESVLLDEARRGMGAQVVTLDTLQTKSLAVLGAGALVAGLAAPKVVGHAAPLVPASLALAAFTVGAILGIDVLRPRTWKFGERLGGYLQWTVDHGGEPNAERAFTRGLARNLELDRADNATALQRLELEFLAQCGLLALQVVLWAIAYALA